MKKANFAVFAPLNVVIEISGQWLKADYASNNAGDADGKRNAAQNNTRNNVNFTLRACAWVAVPNGTGNKK